MRLKSVLSALGIAVAIVLALDYASFAATGKSAILGKLNKANKQTTFQRTTNGPAVGFVAKPGQPPIAVNTTAKVSRLNADLLDGKDSGAFAANNPTKVYKFTASTPALSHQFNLPLPPAGRYLLQYSVATDLLAPDAATPRTGYCEIGQSTGIFGTYQGSAHTSFSSIFASGSTPTAGTSGSAIIDTGSFSSLNVFCNASAAWVTPPAVSFLGTSLAKPATVTLTRLSNTTTSSVTATRLSPEGRQAAQRNAH